MIPNAASMNDFDASDWKLNKAQSRFMSAWLSGKYPITSLMGGWGVGKTRLVAYLIQATHEQIPGSTGFVCTDSMNRGARTIATEMSALLEPLGWTYHFANKGLPAPHWLSQPLLGKQTRVWVLSWKRPSTAHTSANSLEGPDCHFGIIDECNVFSTDEVARAALGRIRSGTPPRLALVGKPMFDAWWLRFAHERGGFAYRAPSTDNRHNLAGFDEWVKALSPREYRENVLADPLQPEGAILDMFEPSLFPKGNLAPIDWEPLPHMRTTVAMDFGVRSPHALVISHDESIGEHGADVVWMEAAPDAASVFDVCGMLRVGRPELGLPGIWPAYRKDAPPGSMPVHAAVGDRSGRQRRDDATLSSSMDDVLTPPTAGGLGLRVLYTDEPAKTAVLAGIRALWRRVLDNSGRRQLLVHPKLWSAGQDCKGRSLSKSIHGYKWKDGTREIIDKDGIHDHAIDALRYFVINLRWPTSVQAHQAKQAFRSVHGRSHPTETRRARKTKRDR